jgi:amino acid transporter
MALRSDIRTSLRLSHTSHSPLSLTAPFSQWAIMLVAFLFNVGLFSFFGLLNSFATTVAVLITVVTVAVILGMHKGDFNSGKLRLFYSPSPLSTNPLLLTASFVFTEYINGTGWDNKGIVFILGMVGSAYSILGFDSVAHLSEVRRCLVSVSRPLLIRSSSLRKCTSRKRTRLER